MVSKIRGRMVDAHWFDCLPRGVRCGEVSIVNKIAVRFRAANVKFLLVGEFLIVQVLLHDCQKSCRHRF
jgi:hypothetical protein